MNRRVDIDLRILVRAQNPLQKRQRQLMLKVYYCVRIFQGLRNQ